MLKQNKRLEAIELYRKANKSPQAAKLLCTIAEETMQTKVNPLRAKKLYILAALELERFKKISLDMSGSTINMTGKYLSEGAAREWSTVVIVIVIFIS